MPGRLILCATPIGNLGDAAPRLTEALRAADVVYAEDTRRSATLLRSLDVDRPLRSYFAGNEAARSIELGRRLQEGATVALLTDAGTPAVSDPGLSAVRAARAAGAAVSVVPGPSAVTAALAVSGLPSERFVFEGFLPRAAGERRARLAAIAAETRTAVLFTTPHRVRDDLADLARACGADRSLCLTRELTKLHEEVWWGTLGEAQAALATREPRGEFTLVLGGAVPAQGDDLGTALARVDELVGQGVPPSEAVRRVAEETGVARRALYQASLRR